MTDVPLRELKRLGTRFEVQAAIFPDDSQSKRVCEWAQEQVQEVIKDYE